MIFAINGARRMGSVFERLLSRHGRAWQIGAALLLILGAKLTLIGTMANPVPYWDQWFGEGEMLFLPYLQHGISGTPLFEAHNEHRILFTRLLVLAVLEICGQWNTIAEMAAGAVLHIVTLGSVIYCLRRVVLPAPLLPTAMLILVFAIPFGGENTLWGFESGNYFVILLGAWTVALTATTPAFERGWWLGYICGVTGIFAMAAAGTALAATGLLAGAQILGGRRRPNGREIAGAILLAGTGIALLAITPHPPGYLEGHPGSVAGFLWSFGLAGGWPVTLPALGPLLLYAPSLCLAWLLWRSRVAPNDHAWRIIGFAAWIALQAAGTAYARHMGPIASRYLDTLGLACVVNACAIVTIIRLLASSKPAVRLLTGMWVGVVTACLSFQAVYFFPRAYFLDPRVRTAQITNISSFLTKGRFGTSGPIPYALTFDDLPRLSRVLERPLIRGLLPAELGSQPNERRLVHERLTLHGGIGLGWERTARIASLAGIAMLVLGIWLYVFLAFTRSNHPRQATSGAIAPR